MRIPAPAKINLHLRVGPPRDDGFHPLLSWMVTVGLFDTLTLLRKPPARRSSVRRANEGLLTLSCDHPTLPLDGRNLVVRAATALADHVSRVGEGPTDDGMTPVSAFLNKRIPSGAGLGGGSSDAAATLIGLNRLWKLGWPVERLATIAATLGSDVPFFLHGPSSVCAGRGEMVCPVAPPDISKRSAAANGSAWAVLVLPKIELSTPAVYGRFDQMKLGREQAIADEPDWASWSKLSAAELMPRLVNDLEPAAFALRPQLKELRDVLERGLGRVVRMSGSGSSLFTLCDGGADEAQSLARRARDMSTDMSTLDAMAVPLAPVTGRDDV